MAAPTLAWELLLVQMLRNLARAEASGVLKGKGGWPRPDAGLASDAQGAEGVRGPLADLAAGRSCPSGTRGIHPLLGGLALTRMVWAG